MASVTLVGPENDEIEVTQARDFVELVYTMDYVPKTGTVNDNYRFLRGAGTTPEPDPHRILHADELIGALPGYLTVDGMFFANVTAVEEAEHVGPTGTWDFKQPPTVNGEPIAAEAFELPARLGVTELAAGAVDAVEAAATVTPTGAWDFGTAPTVNGEPIAADATDPVAAIEAAATVAPAGAWDFETPPTVNGEPLSGGAGGGADPVAAIEAAATVEPGGAWDFDTPPTVNGQPIDAPLPTRLGATELAASAVDAVEAAATVTPTGAWDFDTAPTVNGQPIETPLPARLGVTELAASAVDAVEDAATVAPTGTWNFTTRPTVAGGPLVVADAAATPNSVAGRDANGSTAFAEVALGAQSTNAGSATRRDFVETMRRRTTTNIVAAGRTLVLADEGRRLTVPTTGATGNVIVPLAADVPFPDGTVIAITQFGPGPVVISGANGVTLYGPEGVSGPVVTRARNSTILLTKRSADLWFAEGDMANAVSQAVFSGPGTGRYAQRPAATTVRTGTRYFADDTREEYEALGPAGGMATRWWSPPSNAGVEVGYAKLTIPSFTAPTGTTWKVLPGCFFGFVMPERPVWLTASGTVRYVTTTEDPVLGIFETTGGVITQIAEAHPGQSANAGDIVSADTTARVPPGAPGVWRSFEWRVLSRAAAYTLYSGPLFPPQMRGVLG